ncbi:hypothetical protein ET445_05420 [Agromyces protaetiae]|uniref:Amidohydrolase n=1 Tax=Agromyces protaetiae TaxID=2509455 RepID=A0A4P6FD19_9MICO|nr:hypothetical protein [Agromyces protaetiae]QAY72863.1 hypothetical protein ET445_05420 [Agromyces protaetiae]
MPPADAPRNGAPDLGPLARRVRRSLNGDHPGEIGTMLPPFIDHHVHLMLTGEGAFAGGGIAGVVDLGAPPELVARVADRGGMPRLRFAGAFLTADGGYPTGRPWAAEGSVCGLGAGHDASEAPDAGDADHQGLPDAIVAAVEEQVRFGASVVKVTLHADHGPVLSPAALAELVATAHAHGLPVVAHVEGAGMTALALDAGVYALAHVPFTEALTAHEIARAAAAGQAWISTLWVNGYGAGGEQFDIASDNLRRFRAAGGRVLYGTDLGNGERPTGLDPAELAALAGVGLEASDLIAALADPWPLAEASDWAFGGIATFVAGPPPATLDDVPGWLASARVLATEDLEVLEP